MNITKITVRGDVDDHNYFNFNDCSLIFDGQPSKYDCTMYENIQCIKIYNVWKYTMYENIHCMKIYNV